MLAMKQEPYAFWCSGCKVRHAGECPPKVPEPKFPALLSYWEAVPAPGQPWAVGRSSSIREIVRVEGVDHPGGGGEDTVTIWSFISHTHQVVQLSAWTDPQLGGTAAKGPKDWHWVMIPAVAPAKP